MAGVDVKGFVGPSYTSVSRSINAQRCINLRLEVDLSNGKAPVSLVGLPGYTSIKTDFPSAEVRGFWMAGNRVFVVVGSNLYELNADMTHTERGKLLTETGLVSITDNGLQMLVVDGEGVLALTLADNKTTSVIPNFPYGASSVATVDNTMVANDPNSQRFAISAVGDGLKWNPIDFASVEALPDNLVAIVPFNRLLFMFGTGSLQQFWNSGDASRPFVPVEGAFTEVGCVAPRSAAKDESGVYWLGADTRGGARIYKSTGGAVSVVSTPAMDQAFAGADGERPYVLEDAIGYTFRQDGHVFYVLVFPTSQKTWLFDATTEGWSEYLEWDTEWKRHRVNSTIYAFGKQIGGDFANGKLYEVSSRFFANDGRAQRALRATAHVSQNEANIVIGNLQVVCEPGVGLESGADPQMMLRTSKDGGFTWTPEMTRTMGVQGQYKGRTRWNRPCGSARDLVFEVSVSDPVKRVIVKAVVNSI
jgi:hypothetical protein